MRKVHVVEKLSKGRWKPVGCVYPQDKTKTPEAELVWFQKIFTGEEFRLVKYVPEGKK